METIARELARVNNGNVITPDFRFQPSGDVPDMIIFRHTFAQLRNILRRNISGSSTPKSVSPSTSPPRQVTNPVNPQFSAQSPASSTSNESGREPDSSTFAYDFVSTAFWVLEEELNKVAWYRGSGYEIAPT
jgi:hypothetical protein